MLYYYTKYEKKSVNKEYDEYSQKTRLESWHVSEIWNDFFIF